MAHISFEEQASALKLVNAGQQLRCLKRHQVAALKAAEITLRELALFRIHVKKLDPKDEQTTNRVSDELLKLLRIQMSDQALTPLET